MRRSVVFPVARLESDDYSVPRGSLGIGESMGLRLWQVFWLPPQHGSSVPVADDHLASAGELSIPEHLLPGQLVDRERVATVLRDWLHETPMTQCTARSDTCATWPLAYEITDMILEKQ